MSYLGLKLAYHKEVRDILRVRLARIQELVTAGDGSLGALEEARLAYLRAQLDMDLAQLAMIEGRYPEDAA